MLLQSLLYLFAIFWIASPMDAAQPVPGEMGGDGEVVGGWTQRNGEDHRQELAEKALGELEAELYLSDIPDLSVG